MLKYGCQGIKPFADKKVPLVEYISSDTLFFILLQLN